MNGGPESLMAYECPYCDRTVEAYRRPGIEDVGVQITDEMVERAARAAVEWAHEAQPDDVDMALRCGDRTMARALLAAAFTAGETDA